MSNIEHCPIFGRIIIISTVKAYRSSIVADIHNANIETANAILDNDWNFIIADYNLIFAVNIGKHNTDDIGSVNLIQDLNDYSDIGFRNGKFTIGNVIHMICIHKFNRSGISACIQGNFLPTDTAENINNELLITNYNGVLTINVGNNGNCSVFTINRMRSIDHNIINGLIDNNRYAIPCRSMISITGVIGINHIRSCIQAGQYK